MVALPQIQCQLHDHAKLYDNNGVCHINGMVESCMAISRNGYGNAITGRYGGYFEQVIRWVYGTGESCAVIERLTMAER